MLLSLLLLLAAATSSSGSLTPSKVKIGPDGGYSGLVVKIGPEVPEEK